MPILDRGGGGGGGVFFLLHNKVLSMCRVCKHKSTLDSYLSCWTFNGRLGHMRLE